MVVTWRAGETSAADGGNMESCREVTLLLLLVMWIQRHDGGDMESCREVTLQLCS